MSCQTENYDTPVISFEGPEKRILAHFSGHKKASLRSIDSCTWADLLSRVGCEILSEMRNKYCTSFVLSESSLFVFDDRLMIKTCGRTRLLNFLEPLQEVIDERNLSLQQERVIYSRKNYYFPEAQFAPHRSWQEEYSTLTKILPNGQYRVMGSDNDEDQWFTYTWERDAASADAHPAEHAPVFEVMMMNLSPSKMEQFSQKPEEDIESSPSQLADGKIKYSVTEESGISQLVPDSMIDDFQFDPCGYSMNGLKGPHYWTIHITPESQCSYVSFETNIEYSEQEYFNILQKLVKTFEPGRFTITLYGRQIQLSDIADLPLHKFNCLSREDLTVSHNRHIAMCNYISQNDAEEKHESELVKKHVNERLQHKEQISPFYLVNLSQVVSQMERWKEMLPRVKPLYTVSCNSSSRILELVNRLGAGFDCSNSKDISHVSDLAGADITFSNPYFKQIKDINFASKHHVENIIVDGELSELSKIAKHSPHSKLIIRVNTGSIKPDNAPAAARPDQCFEILQKARELNLDVVGVSLVHDFDSSTNSADRLEMWKNESLQCTKNRIFPLFTQFGYVPSVLDIGGSIWSSGVGLDDDRPGYDAHFDFLAENISRALDATYPMGEYPQLRFVASDSASFLVSRSHTLVCQVFGRRIDEGDSETKSAEYYVNDGYFGSVSQRKVMSVTDRHHHKTVTKVDQSEHNDFSQLISHLEVRAIKTITATTEFHNSSIYGPSCDKSLDCLCKDITLPELEVGDICYFMNMGAVGRANDRTSADCVLVDETC